MTESGGGFVDDILDLRIAGEVINALDHDEAAAKRGAFWIFMTLPDQAHVSAPGRLLGAPFALDVTTSPLAAAAFCRPAAGAIRDGSRAEAGKARWISISMTYLRDRIACIMRALKCFAAPSPIEVEKSASNGTSNGCRADLASTYISLSLWLLPRPIA